MSGGAPPLCADVAAPAPKQEQGAWQAWQGTVFTNAKAGMQSVDAAKVKQVVYEMSKDSAHFRNEERKQVRFTHNMSSASRVAACDILVMFALKVLFQAMRPS